ENIMVSKTGLVKIMDFGLAKRKGVTRVTKEGSTLGTLAYMSPEQAEGLTVDRRSDLFSFGVVMYEMATGQLPFKGEHDAAVLYAIVNEAPILVGSINPNTPKELERFIHKALEKEPEDRYQHADDLAADLKRLKKDLESGRTTTTQAKIPGMRESKKMPVWLVPTSVLVLFIAASLWFLTSRSSRIEASVGLTKIAVLPFESVRNDPGTDFLGFSLADQIITKLDYVQSVVVRPSSAIRKYEGAEIDLSSVARDLDVEVVLTGSYMKEGDRFRLNAQLVNVSRNEIVWREPIEVEYSDIFTVQDSISRKIIAGLKLHLSPEEEVRLRKDVPSNPIAYEYFLKAVANPSVTATDYANQVQLLEKSVQLDSTYSLAWASLGRAYRLYAQFAGNREGYYELAKRAYDRALRLNGELPYAISGLAHFYAETGKVDEAALLLQQALSVNPNAPEFYRSLGYVYRYGGMMDESIEMYVRAQALDSSFASLFYSQIQITKALIYKGEYLAAVSLADSAIERRSAAGQPIDVISLFYQGMAYYYSKDWQRAFAIFDSCTKVDPSNLWSLFGKTYKEAARGNFKRVRSITKSLEERNVVDHEMLYRFTHFYALAGETNLALKSLEASSKGFINYPYINSDPLLESIRATEEFQILLSEVKTRHEAFKRRFSGTL
ncbi:MAG: protein kinase, partial [Candidatus Neomarinimicrobiota bacterium]